jgi:adenylosuccinate synthase
LCFFIGVAHRGVVIFLFEVYVPGTSVIGLQWGDEAKGKIVDLLTERHNVVVRYQGGANAGHTVVFGGKKYKLSLVPSGIFHPTVQCVIAGGVVIDPVQLLSEIDRLAIEGIVIGDKLFISDRAHVIFPWHKLEDRVYDEIGGGEAIGTTMRGIGPCYRDKVGRSQAIRLGELFRDDFKSRVETITESKNKILKAYGCTELPDANQIFDDYTAAANRLKPYCIDTTAYLLNEIDKDTPILFEGAQGALLDVDHGTFPYVTSSNSSGVGIAAGSGVPARFISKMIGVIKAYTTRVGGGPMPTEQDNEVGNKIRENGNEYGTVTKRPRRCGWFDAVAARYTARLSGVDAVAITLLDVLSGIGELKICVAYKIDGHETTDFPSECEKLRRAEPVYITIPGWNEDISQVTDFNKLPNAAKMYVKKIAELLKHPVEIVSVGADRKQTMYV